MRRNPTVIITGARHGDERVSPRAQFLHELRPAEEAEIAEALEADSGGLRSAE